jgi:hypothetical protein
MPSSAVGVHPGNHREYFRTALLAHARCVNAPCSNLLGVDPRMTRLTRVCRAVGVGIAATTATLAMTQVANAAPAPPDVPVTIKPPAGNQPFLVATVIKGVQTYKCSGGTLATSGSVPTADLVGNNDKNFIIHHSIGPTWTATDGSSVSLLAGQKPTATPSPDPANNIPWLLVPVGPAGTSNDPNGRLAGTTFIQRVNTKGGVSPGGACTADVPVPYTADYYFWKATGNVNSKPVT